MKNKCTSLVAVAMAFVLFAQSVQACSWAAFATGNVALVARTVDWYYDDSSPIVGVGRGAEGKTADTPDALAYKAKYASIQIHTFKKGLVGDAINEKGLQGSILFLDDSELPPSQPGRKDIEPSKFIAYAVSNFATVQEVVDALPTLNFIPGLLELPYPEDVPNDYKPENWPGHYAFADASGDKAIIEFIKGEVKVYHGKEHDAMTNEPWYEHHQMFEAMSYKPNGSIYPVDRQARAKQYLRDMHERGVDTRARAILAMRGLLASVFAGTEEIDRLSDNEVYPTYWAAIADLKEGVYYLSRTRSWCSEIYDFTMFPADKPEATVLVPAACPYADRELVSETVRK